MIRPVLRSFFYTGAALYLVSGLSGGGIVFTRGFETFLIATAALSVANHFVRPFLNILLLPINLMTLGLLRWVSSIILLYIVTLVVKGFRIVAFDFSGFATQGITIPELHVTGFVALLVVSFLISFISSFLYWLSK